MGDHRDQPGRVVAGLLALCWVFLWLAACAAPEAPVYPDKRDLLHYLDRQGRPHPIESRTHWDIRRIHILQNMQKVMGPLPRLPGDPLEVQVLETERLPQVERRKITFVSQVVEGQPDRVPAYLLIPDTLPEGQSAPAVLCLHQTTAIGKAEPAGLGGIADLHYALELARRGYVTLAPDYPGFGDYKIDPYAMGYASATMKGILNHRRAVDLLQSLPEVDPDRIGVIGHSLGGHNALFLSAFEPRVRAVATSCGFNAFGHYYGGDLKGWSHRGYMPRIARLYGSDAARMPFDFTEVLGILAPRPVFISAPAGDHNFAVAGVRECMEAALPVYQRLFHSPDRLVARHPEVGHEFPPAVRREAYAFFDRWLSGKRGVILGLENHGGITTRAETMIGILEKVDSPWAGINLDTGNFLQDPYGQIEACAPYAVNVQVKTRVMAPGGKPVPADWGRILQTLAAAGYKGYLALEYEGEEDPVTAVPRYLRELKALAARYGA